MSFRPTKFTTGFTIAEVLIAMAITGLLLAAVAVSFNASVMGYRENEDIFKTINDGRQALFRITTQVRTAAAVDPNSPANECTLATVGGENITYQYNNIDNKLYQIDNSTSNTYLLCDNVTAMIFTKATDIDPSDGLEYVKSIQVSMTVQNNNTEKTFVAAAVVRRNLIIADANE
ncbi:MAG: PilW family protein [Planctomycetota bacterium]|jgi:prepilin-type N-terminal cleavage/methylation domain-containing protein